VDLLPCEVAALPSGREHARVLAAGTIGHLNRNR